MDLGGPPLELHALRLRGRLLDLDQVEVLLHFFILNESGLAVGSNDS